MGKDATKVSRVVGFNIVQIQTVENATGRGKQPAERESRPGGRLWFANQLPSL